MKQTARTLTKAELRRKEAFDRLCLEMELQGYERQDHIVSVLAANLWGVLLPLPFVFEVALIYFYYHPFTSIELSLSAIGLFFVCFLALVVLHELLHGLTWAIFAKHHLRTISFGIILPACNPYCTCSEPLKRWQYALGAAMPTLLLGVGVAAAAVATGSLFLILLAGCMILAGGGDLYLLLHLLGLCPSNSNIRYYDHPYECGFVFFTPKTKQ